MKKLRWYVHTDDCVHMYYHVKYASAMVEKLKELGIPYRVTARNFNHYEVN